MMHASKAKKCLPNKLHVVECAEREGRRKGMEGGNEDSPPTLFHVAQFLVEEEY